MPMEVKIAHRKPNELIEKQKSEDKGTKAIQTGPSFGGVLQAFNEGQVK